MIVVVVVVVLDMVLHGFGIESSALFAVSAIPNGFQCLACQFLHGLYWNDAFVASLVFILVVAIAIGISSDTVQLLLSISTTSRRSSMRVSLRMIKMMMMLMRMRMTMMMVPSLRTQPMLMILQFRHPLPRTKLPLDAIILFSHLHPQLRQYPFGI